MHAWLHRAGGGLQPWEPDVVAHVAVQGYWRANANGSLHQVSTWLRGADKRGPSRSLRVHNIIWLHRVVVAGRKSHQPP